MHHEHRIIVILQEEEDNDSPPPRLSFRPSSNGLREGAKNGKQRIQRLDGLRNIQVNFLGRYTML